MTAMHKLWAFRLAVATGGGLAMAILLAIFGLNPIVFAGCALMGLQPLGLRLFRVRAPGATDERDTEIGRKAVIIGYSTFWLVFVLAFVGLPFATGNTAGAIEVRGILLPFVPMVGWLILEVSQSVAALVLYGRE